MFSNFVSNKPKRASLDDNAAGLIAHFEHSYDARLIATKPENLCPPAEESSYEDNNVKLPKEGRQVSITLSGEAISVSEHIGTRIGDMSERKIIEMQWTQMVEIAWDHQQSQVRFKKQAPDEDSDYPYSIFLVANSLELEANIKLRLKGLANRVRGGARLPSSQYIGMFAGVTKPKPFQRKRASLTTDPSEQLPPLDEMRSLAVEAYRGSGKPMDTDASARRSLAIEHIYDGKCTFLIGSASGPGLEGYQDQSLLCLGENDVSYYASAHAMQSNNKSLYMQYDEIESWDVHDSMQSAQRCLVLVQKNSNLSFSFTLKAGYDLPTLLHLRHCMEFFWNQYLEHNNIPAFPHTTHGRAVARVFTLQGHQDPVPPPLGELDIKDENGNVVANFNEKNRRSSSVGAKDVSMSVNNGPVIGSGKFEAVRRNTAQRTTKRGSFFGGSKSSAPAVERYGAREIWSYVVKHQGWLCKKGGVGPTGKKWLDRYFVLYSTAMGHFLSYYSNYGDSPLFSNERKERNLIDLGKVTFIRPVSNQQEAPAFSFDIVTIERDWTLSASNENEMQRWLQLLTTAVDEDVAIVPDDDLCFEVKTLRDPTDRLVKFDYSTLIKVSAYGVSIGTKGGKYDYQERFFWCYTDFYKWSVQNQFGKLTLFVSVFGSDDFNQNSKMDMEFRTRQAVQLASAIEFYIEKFMSIMYLKNEGLDVEGGGDVEYGNDEDNYEDQDTNALEDVSDDEPESVGQMVDLLSLDDAPSPPVATAVNDGFGSGIPVAEASVGPPVPPSFADPFGGGGAGGGADDLLSLGVGESPANGSSGGASDSLLDTFTTPSVSSAPKQCMDNMDNVNVPQFLKGKKEGVLYSEPGLINVMLKHEWRGSQGRVSLCYVNAGRVEITGIKAEVKAEDNNAAAIRTMLNPLAGDGKLAPGSQTVQQLMVECVQPFEALPVVTLDFEVAGAKRSYKLKVPCSICNFIEGTPMEGDDFMSRWQKLNTPSLQFQTVINSKAAVVLALVDQILTGCGLKTIPSLAEKSGGICAVGTLRTGSASANGGKISVGILTRIEINAAAQAYRVTIRTAHGGVSKILGEEIKRRL